MSDTAVPQADGDVPFVSYDVGATPEDTFVVPFQFWEKDDLIVSINDVPTTDFNVTGETEPNGGQVILTTPVTNSTVAIQRVVQQVRYTVFPIAGPFRIEALNDEFDRIIAMLNDNQFIFETLPDYAILAEPNTFTAKNTFDGDVDITGLLSVFGAFGTKYAGQDQFYFWNENSPQTTYHVMRAGDDGNIGFFHGTSNTFAMTIEAGGTAALLGSTAMTREKADFRYVNIDGDGERVGTNFTVSGAGGWIKQRSTTNSAGLQALSCHVHTDGAVRWSTLNDDLSFNSALAQIDRDGGVSRDFSLLTRAQGDARYLGGGGGLPSGGTTGQVLAKIDNTDYNTEWRDETGGGGGAVDSVFGRTGAVTAQVTDYNAFYALLSHTHTESQITDLDKYTQAQIDTFLTGKANVSHTHTESEITDLDKYTQAQVDALVAGKSDTSHTHTFPQLTDVPNAYTDEGGKVVAVKDDETGLEFVPAGSGGAVSSVFGRTGAVSAQVGDYSAFYAPLSHTHTESDVTDLNRVRPRGIYNGSDTYLLNDMASQNGYTGVTIVASTQDPIEPTITGDPILIYQGLSPTVGTTAKTLMVGQEYTLTQGGWFTEYEIYTVVGNSYTVFKRTNDGASQQIISFLAASDGWQTFTTNKTYFPANTKTELFVIIDEPAPGDVDTVLAYNYATPSNDTNPVANQISHATKTPESLKVHYTGIDGDNTAYLRSLTVGDTIDGAGTRWSIQEINDFPGSNYIEFVVAPAIVGVSGSAIDFTFTATVSTPITTVDDPDYFVSDSQIRGFKSVDGATRTFDNDAYGVNVTFQAATQSSDWWVISTPSEGAAPSGGGGGVERFTELSDTPNSYADSNLMVPRVDEDGNQLVFDNMANYFVSLNGSNVMTGRLQISWAGQDMINFTNTGAGQANPHAIRATSAGDIGFSHGVGTALTAIIEAPAETLKDDLSLVTRAKGDARYPKSADVRDIEVMTQAEYDGITPVATTMYVIVG